MTKILVDPDGTKAVANSVVSRDGTTISYQTVGAGPSVLVIPGALSTAADYIAFARALAVDFTVHTIDRRGRGLSGPQGDQYTITKECEDLLAIQDKTGATFIVGHSYGGLVTLEFARNNKTIRNIAVYEPGVSIDGSIPMDWIGPYENHLSHGQYLDALVTFVLGVGPDRARRTPHWVMKLLLPLFIKSHERQSMFQLLSENLREHREVSRLDSTYRDYREISAGALLMYGGKSDSKWVRLSMERLASVIPSSTTREFPDLDHFGIDQQAPEEVARAVGKYFMGQT